MKCDISDFRMVDMSLQGEDVVLAVRPIQHKHYDF